MPDDLRAEKGYYAVSGCGGNIAWHTENDTLEIADKDVLKTDIGIYLLSIWRLATAKRLPVDWRALMAEFRKTVAAYQDAAAERFDLSPVAEEIDALAAALEDFHVRRDDLSPERANAVLRRLARVLVPLNYTRSPRFNHDPAITRHPLPAIEVVTELDLFEGDRQGFALTQALRGRNRTVAALREAQALVNEA